MLSTRNLSSTRRLPYICRECLQSIHHGSSTVKPLHRGLSRLQSFSNSRRYYTTQNVLIQCNAPPTAKLSQRDHYTVSPIPHRNYTQTASQNLSKPFRLAIIGSGPAGFYTTLRLLEKHPNAIIDMYETLPVPYGLVRFGVAPDHPEVKNCQDRFEEVASSPRFNFIGNIDVGDGLGLEKLKTHYDAMCFAHGATKDRLLGVEGEEELKGVYGARGFVGWYNGVPSFRDVVPDLNNAEDVVVIGQGNVAMDVARILLTPVDMLRKTDIAEYALEALSKSRVKRVSVVGRRGPVQAAFTTKEARELMALPNVYFEPIDPAVMPPDGVKLTRTKKRIMDVLKAGSSATLPAPDNQMWTLRFLLSPNRFLPSENDPSRLGAVEFAKNEFVPDHETGMSDMKAQVQTTNQMDSIRADLAFRSVGYKSQPLPGFQELGIPFDSRYGIIPNDVIGRIVIPPSFQGSTQTIVPGMYCAGWVKKGPTGVIASTMLDAFNVADAIVEDCNKKNDGDRTVSFINDSEGGGTGLGWKGVKAEAEKMGLRRVSWEDWKIIDAAERERGKARGKDREKFASVEEMLQVLDG